MAMVMEFIGLSPMGTASVPATDPRKDEVGVRCGRLVMDLLQKNLRPRDILTRQAFENAIGRVHQCSAPSARDGAGIRHPLDD